MLNSLTLGNFKVARELTVPLAPLTMLAGLNGSGKSTVLQSLAAIYQSYLTGRGDSLNLGGPLISLGKGSDILNNTATNETISFKLKEGNKIFPWRCRVTPDASQFKFIISPSSLPSFISSPGFQYLQADRIVPRTLYPQSSQDPRQPGFLGTHGEFTADFLSRNSNEHVSKNRRCDTTDPIIEGKLWKQIAPPRHFQIKQRAGYNKLVQGFNYNRNQLHGLMKLYSNFVTWVLSKVEPKLLDRHT